MMNTTDTQNSVEMPSMNDMMEQLGVSNPLMRNILENMMIQNQEPTPQNDDVIQMRAVKKNKIKMLLRENNELREENGYLADRIEMLSAALGACPVCWGEYDDCEECRGDGSSGCYEPDKRYFNIFVRPAIEASKLRGSEKSQNTDAKKVNAAKRKSK